MIQDSVPKVGLILKFSLGNTKLLLQLCTSCFSRTNWNRHETYCFSSVPGRDALHGELREGQPAERAGVQPLQGRAGPESAERERAHRPAEEGGGRDAGGAAEGEPDHQRDPRDPRVVTRHGVVSPVETTHSSDLHLYNRQYQYTFKYQSAIELLRKNKNISVQPNRIEPSDDNYSNKSKQYSILFMIR